MSLELLFLGTGTSAGVPMIGCHCPVCSSTDPRDQRTRPSVLVRYPPPPPLPEAARGADTAAISPSTRSFLIDTTPEIRVQAVRHRIDRLDGVFYTHAHADHIFGLDDLRRFNAVMQAPLDIFAEAATVQTLRGMFRYVFESHTNVNQTFVATLIARTIEVGVPLELLGARWTPLRLLHGRLPILGFRVDYQGQSLAYCTDVSTIPNQTFPLLEDMDVLVIDGLRYRHHPTHMTVEQSLAAIDRIQPRQAYLTHIAHDILHADLDPRLPPGVALAYDGLLVDCGKVRGEGPRQAPYSPGLR